MAILLGNTDLCCLPYARVEIRLSLSGRLTIKANDGVHIYGAVAHAVQLHHQFQQHDMAVRPPN